MPIRPIDMITVAPRSMEASQQHLQEQHKAESAQSNVAQQFVRHTKENAEVVIQTSKGEQQEYRYDAKEKGNGTYGKSKRGTKKAKKKETEKEKSEEIKRSSFDIKI